MSWSNGEFVSSFVVAYGEIESSPRGHDDLHMLLADRLAERISREVPIGSFASGVVLSCEGRCAAQLNRLPRGVARAEVQRLIAREFGGLGDVDLVIREGGIAGEVDEAWPFEWEEGQLWKGITRGRE